MKRRNKKIKYSVFSFRNYVGLLVFMCIVITIGIMGFVYRMDPPLELLRRNAIVTLANVLFLSLIFFIIDSVRRRITIHRPLNKIIDAIEKISQGDYDVKIKPDRPPMLYNEFDYIIENIDKMAGELSGVETLRMDFISNVSHELKTPISIINNYSTILQSKQTTEEEREECIKVIGETSAKLSQTITNILKLNKLENQLIFPEDKNYNLSGQLCEALLAVDSIIDEKQIELETDIEDDIFIRSDANLLEIVWSNLISNAIKFTAPNGKISVSMKSESDYVVAVVADNGCGMSPETCKHIFEKFYQGDTSHSGEGNGLGLALVKRVIEVIDGDISVESSPGEGSCFTVRIPKI